MYYSSGILYGSYAVHQFLKQARAGQRPVCTWFLKITSVRMYVCVCMCVCGCVCVRPPLAIKNYSREMKSE